METFGEWLRQQRTQQHLTREQLAERVACSVALLRKVEDGERRPSTQIAELLANALHIPSTERAMFVKVARGEWRVDRLSAIANSSVSGPVSPSLTTPRTNLPHLATPLIGRQTELAELRQLLNDDRCHLLTLVGPGGIGKTCLALETATHMQEHFADGVYFVSCASIDSPSKLVPLIADALGFAFPSAGATDPKRQLLDYLQTKRLLLLLDNLEQLVAEPGILWLAEILTHAPEVKLLVTSRQALDLHAEWVYEVSGLPIPEGGSSELQGTALELYLQRARQAKARFQATSDDVLAIVHICQLVEGMPLAIELAATWIRTLTCAEIAHELEQGLDFLHGSARDLPARHHSLRAVFDHSWLLLSDTEQSILRQLAVFRSGFRRDAAEIIVGATLTTLAALLNKSLLRRNEAGRFEMHELIRQFAAEQLAQQPSEQRAAQATHAHYYLTLFGNADEHLRSAAQQATLVELTAEVDNLRTAWEWAVSQGEVVLLDQTLRAFTMYYDTRGWFQEGFDLQAHTANVLTSAAASTERTALVTLGRVLACQALFAFRLAHYEHAQILLEHSLTLLRPLNVPSALVEALTFQGIVTGVTGNYNKATQYLNEGLTLARAIGDRWFAALCLILQLDLSLAFGPSDANYAQLQQAVAEWRAIGDPRFTALALNSLSLSALLLGHLVDARVALEECVALNQTIGDRYGVGSAYRSLGIVAQAQNEHSQAIALFQQSLAIFSELGARQDRARALAELGESHFAVGNIEDAERAWQEALRIATETQGSPVVMLALLGFARLHAERGDLAQTLTYLEQVIDHPASTQEIRQRAMQLRAGLET
ncbi:MAG: tetratricopeptide repeat protein [Caldilineaceae bacterium]